MNVDGRDGCRLTLKSSSEDALQLVIGIGQAISEPRTAVTDICDGSTTLFESLTDDMSDKGEDKSDNSEAAHDVVFGFLFIVKERLELG